jgi:hypothetical protein
LALVLVMSHPMPTAATIAPPTTTAAFLLISGASIILREANA